MSCSGTVCFSLPRKGRASLTIRSGNRHLTCAAGALEHTSASASLARTLLARHLQLNLNRLFQVYTFEDLADQSWLAYVARQKVRLLLMQSPMLALTVVPSPCSS